MPTENVSNRNGANPYFVDYWKVRSWNSSDRAPNGRLILRNNPYQYLSGTYGARVYPRGYHTWLPATPPSGTDLAPALLKGYAFKALESKCYEKLRGKLYKGTAALGVTFGSMAQSRAMVVARANTLRSLGADVVRDATQIERRHGLYSNQMLEYVAGAHLEIIFGWVPLVADIHAACTTVIQMDDANRFISVSANTSWSGKTGYDTYALRSRVSYSTSVRVANPNKWLAERAGLLNPASVAWDLVPWSFVVNMFVNTGQLVQQITDFAGLEFTDTYATKTGMYSCNREMVGPSGSRVAGFWKGFDQRRAVAAFPKPPGLMLRLPEANWELAAMASSLFIQQFTKVSRFIAPFERELLLRRKKRKRLH